MAHKCDSEVLTLYTVTKIEREIEDQAFQIYAVENNGQVILDFTTDKAFAEQVVGLLNENDVELNHVVDVIEDLVY